MARLELILAVAILAFTIFAFVDCLITDSTRVRALPKVVWAIIIILLSPFGGILWLAIGKERNERPSSYQRPVTKQRAPDDDPAFLQRLGADKERDERIKELERRLAELDDDHDDPKK